LISEETYSAPVSRLLSEDDEVVVWWGTWVECAVAISRLSREGRLDEEAEEEARIVLNGLTDNWTEIRPTDELRILAALVSEDYSLKAADALQLASALRWCEGDTRGRRFVCLDDRLRRAASDEGFRVLPSPSEEGDEEL
jgi:predicted nucleic acid-binding protein